MCEITEADLQDLLDEIQGTGSTVRFFTVDETVDLRKSFHGIKTVGLCFDTHLETLYNILVPFRDIKHIFLNNIPAIELLSSDSGKTFIGKRERIYLYETMRREKLTEEKWMMRVVKRLAAREVPEDVVLPKFHSGYVKVHKVVQAKGAFKYFLKVLGRSFHPVKHFIFYRGTRPVLTATGGFDTLLEDLRSNLGSEGPKATFDETHALLTDPKLGYIKTPNDPKKAIGVSLGGTHLMRDAVLHDIFDLVTIASPGVDPDLVKLFNQKVEKTKAIWNIVHYFEDEDVMDQLEKYI